MSGEVIPVQAFIHSNYDAPITPNGRLPRSSLASLISKFEFLNAPSTADTYHQRPSSYAKPFDSAIDTSNKASISYRHNMNCASVDNSHLSADGSDLSAFSSSHLRTTRWLPTTDALQEPAATIDRTETSTTNQLVHPVHRQESVAERRKIFEKGIENEGKRTLGLLS